MSLEGLAVDAWFSVIHAFEVTDGGELGEVFPAFVRFSKESEVGGVLAVGDFLFVFLPARAEGGEVDFTAEDGFHAFLFAFLVEIDGSEEIAVVGHGDGGHAEFRGASGEFLGADHAVKE